MNLNHIKLNNGEDILAYVEIIELPNKQKHLRLHAPISIHMDPEHGFFAKSWLLLSETNMVSLPLQKIMFCNTASEKAQTYYDQFMEQLASSAPAEEQLSDIEELLSSMLESKSSIKH